MSRRPDNRPSSPQRMTSSVLDARVLAAHVLERVLGDGAYGAAALNHTLERYSDLDARTRAQCTELFYTTLRSEPSLRKRLLQFAPKGLPVDPVFLSHLLVAAAQLLLLEHRTAAVAVDVAVSQIRASRGAGMAGFANAILRKLAASAVPCERQTLLRESCPQWLYDALVVTVGASEADALLGVTGAEAHPIALRLRFDGRVPAGLEGSTAGTLSPLYGRVPAGLEGSTAGTLSPLCRKVVRVGDPTKLDGYAEGRFVIQEEGAQLIALALDAKPGERILDACAGRGQKTTLLAEQVAPGGVVCATDIHPKKLAALQIELERLGLSGVTTAAVDWSRGSGAVTELFDKALVDAPCTGTGTLRKRPEIATRLGPEDPSRLGALATAILRQVAQRVRPGGTVVFAVCSVLAEESEAVVDAVRDLLRPVPFEVPSVVRALGQGATMGRLLPGRHGTDGYFIANLQRIEGA